jgi:CHAT domain-containing protein
VRGPKSRSWRPASKAPRFCGKKPRHAPPCWTGCRRRLGSIFAGHAEQRSWQDGGPVLHCWDGPLAATDIAMVALDRAEIAVLSACDTAFGDVELRDEAAHLSGAFQIAGFRHVVATQWPVNDRRARVAVRTFYRHVTGDAKTSDAAHAAVAVWQVLRDERAAYPDRPAIWAPFVHFGP